MPTSDQIRDYFNTRITQEMEKNALIGVSEKYDAIQAAAKEKKVALAELRKEREAIAERNKNSWVGQLDLDPEGLAGEAVNMGASLYSGASRVAGNLASLVPSALALADESMITKEEADAYNRKVKGAATPEDMALLTRKKAMVAERDTPEAKARAQAMADANPKAPTALDLIERSVKNRETSRNITNAFDQSGAVHSGERDKLTYDLGAEFQSAWDQTGLANTFEDGKEVGGAKDMITGLAKLIYNAGDAAVSHPVAASEYVIENLPQLVGGLFGKGGKIALTATNAGYAADNYMQGLEKFANENGGALPSPEERRKMALYAASTMVAEQLGELGQLKAIGKVRTAADVAQDASQVGIGKAILNTGKAGVTGGAEEMATEGYQTFAEGEAQLMPASAKDVYTGAVIGGLAGGGTSGGVHAIAETLGATPEKQALRERDAEKAKVIEEALKTGKVDALLDPKSAAYSPAHAVAALYGHATAEDATPEQREANLAKAAEIVENLRTQRDEIKDELDKTSVEGLTKILEREKAKLATAPTAEDRTRQEMLVQVIEEEIQAMAKNPTDKTAVDLLETKLSKVDRYLTESEQALEVFNQESQPKDIDIKAQIQRIQGSDAEVSQSAASSIINLSMASPDRLAAEDAKALADNTNLTAEQRQYFRAFSEARLKENAMRTIDAVESEVKVGSDKNIGINQYRRSVANALAGNNLAGAAKQISQLKSFAEDHQAKAEAVNKAHAISLASGNPVQVRSDGKRGWFVHTGTPLTAEELRREGGLSIHPKSDKLLEKINAEAQALTSAATELEAAHAVKSNQKSKSTGAKDVENVSSSPAGVQDQNARSGEAASEGQEGSSAERGSAGKRATTNGGTSEGSEQTAVAESAKEAPASTVESVKTEEDQGQLQSTEKTTPETKAEATANSASDVGTLTVLQQKSTEGTSYAARNLIADYFTQSKGGEEGAPARPLATVRNFLTQSTHKVIDFLKDKTLSSQQVEALHLFRNMSLRWGKNIQQNLIVSKKDFWYTDMMQFLITNEGGQPDLEQNIKTAMSYAVFSYVAEQYGRTPFNTDEEINAILNRDENHPVSQDERHELGLVGTRQNVIINSLGQRAVQALGLKAKKDAPKDLMPKLESALGAHIMKLMLDQGILERVTVSGQDMAALTGSESTNQSADFQFLKIARDANGELNEQAKEITEAVKGSKNVLDNLFKVEPSLKAPSLTPIPFTQNKTKNTNQKVPERLAKIIEHENKVANFVRQDMWQLVTQLGEDVLQTIAGVVPVDDTKVHVTNRASMQAKNDGLIRELSRFFDFVKGMDDIEAPMYFDHTVWKQQRVGISTNVINPQTSKIHRFMLFRKSWETKVEFNDQAQMDNFRLRVLEGLGVKTDKQENAKSLAQYQSIVGNEVIQKAVAVLQKATYEGGIDEAGQQAIVAAVKQGGEKFHSLDALMALAHEAQARADGKADFTVHMMGEIDGVTNGPMLSHLLLGAASSVEALFGLLNRGGFFQKDSGNTNYNVWRGQPGHLDLYEITALHMTQAVQQMLTADSKLGATLNAIYAFTGTLAEKDGTVAKAGRNIIKTPLTAMVFGSSVKSAVDSMADGFIESIYSSIEDVAAGKADAKEVLNHINTLIIMGKGPSLKPMSTDQLLNYEFNPAQIKAIKKSFTDTLGKAVQTTMEGDFGAFIAQRNALNRAAQMAFEMYNAAYEGMRESFMAELIERKEIAVNSKGQPIHDLTSEQEAELRSRIKKLTPLLHTLMSSDSGSLGAGLYSAKTERKLSTKATYQNEVKFGSKFKDTGAKSTKTHGNEVVQTNPGVGMVVMSTHATDSAISHYALEDNEVLNVHDAHGAGLGIFTQTAQNLNESTFKAMLSYSPAAEMADMLSRTVRGMAQLLQQADVPVEVQQRMIEAMANFSKREEMTGDAVFFNTFAAAKAAAFTADNIRLQALAQMGSVDQYALEGGNYEVTEEDRQKAEAQRAELSNEWTADEVQAAEQVARVLGEALGAQEEQTAPAETVETVFGPTGKPAIRSQGDLVKFFEANPNATAAQVIELLAQPGRLNGVNRKLLMLVRRVINPNLPIQYVTAETAEGEVLQKPQKLSRGWYISKGGKEAIYVLSPEFKASGLTTETLLHELVHAAVAKVIANPTGDAKALVDELESLRTKAAEFVKANNLQGFAAALGDVQEFVAWGMTNLNFQREVLAKFNYESQTRGNKLVTAMEKFISTITRLLFNRPDAALETGLGVLVSNVSGLMAAADARNVTESDLNLSQESATEEDVAAAIDAYTTLDIHNALDNGAVEPVFKAHLANLLGGIVEKLHGPFGAFAAQMRKTEAGNPLSVWLKAIETGKAPFASAIIASGFAGSAQEDFAMQQVEATIKAALDGNEAITKTTYRELSKLYDEAKAKLTVSDFGSQEDYDFVFNVKSGADGRSDYLARFAALGLANQKFNKLLQFNTAMDTRRLGEGKTFTERLMNVFEKVMAFFNEKITHTYGGQRADEKLDALVQQLVDIEARKRHLLKLRATSTNYLAPIEKGVHDTTEMLRKKVGEVAGSDWVRNNKNAFVKAAGGLARTVANDQVEFFIEGVKRLHDREFKGRQGVVASLLNELKGPHEVFNALLRETKRHEGERKAIITQRAALALKSFIDNGENLSKDTKAAISAVFLRTGMHHLVGKFTMAEMENLLDNPAAIQKAINDVEAQLTTAAKGHYIEQANGLGYFKATGKSRTAVLMLNAHLIARLKGTQFQNLITEQEAAAAEPLIAQLATLYALKYSESREQSLAKEAFRAENARTDGNGIEVLLGLHKNMEQMSLDRLFKGNPALMVHGYTPEILNPHTAIKIAGEEEGKDLINQGYSKGAEITQDEADPDQAKQHIYVQRDGGLAPYLSGAFSLSSMKAKGTTKHDGYVNPRTFDGAMNASLQADLTDAKLNLMNKRVDPRRDLSKQSGNHLVPVFNESGEIVNWRYMMAESTKNTLLERDNRFDQILGALAGSIYDKETTKEQNDKVVHAIREQFKAGYKSSPESFVMVGEKSDDAELRALWALLPQATRDTAKDVWGYNGMMVRSDSLDILFGYRKYSLAQMFAKDPEARNKLEQLFVTVIETVLANYAGYKHGLSPEDAQAWAKRAAVMVTRGERAWQEIVREAKDIIVVKSGFVMLGNIWSNFSLLALSGVPLKDILNHHLVAIKAATAYQEEAKKLADLEALVEVGYSFTDAAAAQNEMNRLRDSLARNPVRELIEAGLMPTIVEDVAAEDDPFSFKSEFERKTEKWVNKLNPNVVEAGRFIYMTHDTPMYQTLSKITQLSDFVARYTLYQHLTNRQENPLSKEQAIAEASDAFVNYDIPMHRGLQYTDDMGFTMFTKYFLRIQRVLLKMTRDNPLRVFLALTLNGFMDLGPIVLDSHFVHHIGNNPMNIGAFQYPGALDELATVKSTMSLFK